MSVIIERKYFDNLKVLRNLLKASIREHERVGAPKVIIDEMQEALNLIIKAIDILERDDE